jgi:hypothetical protein
MDEKISLCVYRPPGIFARGIFNEAPAFRWQDHSDSHTLRQTLPDPDLLTGIAFGFPGTHITEEAHLFEVFGGDFGNRILVIFYVVIIWIFDKFSTLVAMRIIFEQKRKLLNTSFGDSIKIYSDFLKRHVDPPIIDLVHLAIFIKMHTLFLQEISLDLCRGSLQAALAA